MPQAAWNLVGLALRLVQERGTHRRRGEGYKPTAVDELWKRCFWYDYFLQIMSTILITSEVPDIFRSNIELVRWSLLCHAG